MLPLTRNQVLLRNGRRLAPDPCLDRSHAAAKPAERSARPPLDERKVVRAGPFVSPPAGCVGVVHAHSSSLSSSCRGAPAQRAARLGRFMKPRRVPSLESDLTTTYAGAVASQKARLTASMSSGERPSRFLISSLRSTWQRPWPSTFQVTANACCRSACRTSAGSRAKLTRLTLASSAVLNHSSDRTLG